MWPDSILVPNFIYWLYGMYALVALGAVVIAYFLYKTLKKYFKNK